jgi:hypothetical protein
VTQCFQGFTVDIASLRKTIEHHLETCDESLKQEIAFIVSWFATAENLASRPNGRWVHNSLPSMRAHVDAILAGNLLTLSPSLAVTLLSRTKTRQLTATHVAKIDEFARVMRDGLWRDGGFIHLTDDGALLDGCHRSHAVIRSGSSVRLHVLCSSIRARK